MGCNCHRTFSRITARDDDGRIIWRQPPRVMTVLAEQAAYPKPARMDRWAYREMPRPVHGNETRRQQPAAEGTKNLRRGRCALDKDMPIMDRVRCAERGLLDL